jgi:CDP-glucose 4,6-dehydratase
VSELIAALAAEWPGAAWDADPPDPAAPPEARLLKLSCDRALAELHWRALLSVPECVRFTAEWYRDYYRDRGGAAACTARQIASYMELAGARGLRWARG